jgi:hypothetical protein
MQGHDDQRPALVFFFMDNFNASFCKYTAILYPN